MITREQITAALATIPTLGASPTTPAVIVAGSAWPVWQSTRWLNKCAREVRWFVFVALTNGELQATVDAADPWIEQVPAALDAIGLGQLQVETVMWALEVGGAGIPCLRITAVD